MLARTLKALASPRLAAWLIATLLALLLVSFLVPQRGIFPDTQVDAFFADMPDTLAWLLQVTQFDRIFTSTLFYLVAIVLAINLLACTIKRIPARMRRREPAFSGLPPKKAQLLRVTDIGAARRALDALGAARTVDEGAEGRYYLRRGAYGFGGSLLLHAGLVLVLVGGVVSGVTTFRGEMVITEGQTRGDVPDEYLEISHLPSFGAGFRDFALTLDSMSFSYEEGTVVDAVAHMRVHDPTGERVEQARVNYPLKAHGKSFLLQDAGHSVWLTVRDSSGSMVFDGFLNLLNASETGYTDSHDLGGVSLSVVSRPDASVPVSNPVGEGLDLKSPIVGVSLAGGASARSPVWVRPGEAPVSIGSYTVAVNEVRVWNRFMVRADQGRHVVYAAFFLVILGAVVRFLDPDRWLKAVLVSKGDDVELYYWGAERYRTGAPRESRRLKRLLQSGSADRRETEESGDDR